MISIRDPSKVIKLMSSLSSPGINREMIGNSTWGNITELAFL